MLRNFPSDTYIHMHDMDVWKRNGKYRLLALC